MSASNNAGQTRRGRPFERGNRAGRGRKAGSRNKATLLLDKIAEGDAKAILEKQLELAKNGDQQAAQLVLSRTWPVRRGRPVSLELPVIKSAGDVVTALSAVADSVASGALTPDEGQAVAAVLETKRRAIETVELESRIAALEEERSK